MAGEIDRREVMANHLSRNWKEAKRLRIGPNFECHTDVRCLASLERR